MSWRFLHLDRETKQRTDYYYDADNDRCVLRYSENVEPALEANKRLSGVWDGWNGKRDMRLAARIPAGVQYEWLNKYGIRAWDKNHKKAVLKLLNSNEYRHLRVGHFII
jgi:hypothetical protein